jgi:hypothetical protein
MSKPAMTSRSPEDSSRSLWILLIVILIFGVVLRWVDLGARSLWWDELFSVVSSARSPSISALWSDWMVDDSHPPGFQLALWMWFKLVPATEFWARVPSAVFGTAMLVFAAFGTRSVLSQTGRAMLTSLLGCAYGAVYYAQEARQYSAVLCFGLIAMVLGTRLYRESGSSRLWTGFVLVALSAAYTHYFGLFLCGLLFLALLFAGWRQGGVRGTFAWFKSMAAFSVLYLPGVLCFVHLMETDNGAWQRRRSVKRFFSELFGGFFLADPGSSAALLGCMMALCAIAWWRWRPKLGNAVLAKLTPSLFVLIVAVVVVYFANQRSPVLQVRYYLVFLAPLVLAISIGVDHILSASPNGFRGLVVLLPILGVFAWYPGYQDYEKQGWREATAWVKAEHQAGDAVAVLGPDGTDNAAELMQAGLYNDLFWLRNYRFFQYYFDRTEQAPSGEGLRRLRNVRPRGDMPEIIARGDPGRFILLGGHHLRLSKKLKQYMKGRYTDFKLIKFKSTRVYFFWNETG